MIKKADKIYVLIQALLFIIYLIPFTVFRLSIMPFIRYTGIFLLTIGVLIAIIALLQLNRFLTPFPTPKKESKLLQSGIYKFIRHPIYTGIILASFGYSFYAESVWKFFIAVLLFILFYLKSKYEESLLMNHFVDYQNYRKVTGRFFPFI